MTHEVVFRPRADGDLQKIFSYLRRQGVALGAARSYTDRIRDRCAVLSSFPERGSIRDRASGSRIIGFERRVAIVFRVRDTQVEILRILYGGRDIRKAMRNVR